MFDCHYRHQSKSVHICADDVTGDSTWVVDFDDMRWTLCISPEVWRGFSGEGQALDALSSPSWKEILPRVQAALNWQSVLRPEPLAEKLAVDLETIDDCLKVLGSRGSVGYDLCEQTYSQVSLTTCRKLCKSEIYQESERVYKVRVSGAASALAVFATANLSELKKQTTPGTCESRSCHLNSLRSEASVS